MSERGVKQGSVLSPALFLLVMDPLLRLLEQSGLSLSVNNFYAGGGGGSYTPTTSGPLPQVQAQLRRR